jgi:hypothetical protein
MSKLGLAGEYQPAKNYLDADPGLEFSLLNFRETGRRFSTAGGRLPTRVSNYS